MTNPNYPATSLSQSTNLVIEDSNLLHSIINGTDTEEIIVDDGSIPSLRKMIKDNFYFKNPIDWVEGNAVTEFNQLVKFTDGTLWVAPTARTSNPILMGVTPVGDSLWETRLYGTSLQQIARSLNVLDSAVIYSTDTVTVLDNVQYIYDAGTQTTLGVPALNGSGETITDVTGSNLTTTGGSYTLDFKNIGYCQNVEVLKQLPLDSDELIRTKGYYSAGDNGSAVYVIKTAAQASSDGDIIDGYGNHTLANGLVAVINSSDIITKQFGAKYDGSDDYLSIQAALDMWRLKGGLFLWSAGTCTVESELLVEFTASSGNTRSMKGYGATVSAGNTVTDVLTIRVSNALARLINIKGLKISGQFSGFGLVIDGASFAGTGEFLYNCTFKEMNIVAESATAGGAMQLKNNFFESTVQDCHLATSSKTGYPLHITAQALGVISSITLIQNTTRGGLYGVYADSNTGDVNIIGGTYLGAEEYGIYIANAQGGHITGAHVEQCWVSATSHADGQAGIYVITSPQFTVRDCYGVNSTRYMTNVVRAFVSGNLNIVGGYGNGIGGEYASLSGTGSDSACAFLSGGMSYQAASNINVMTASRSRMLHGIQSTPTTKITNPATVTPTALHSTYFVSLATNPPTINLPSFTPQNGDELTFMFEQNGAGGATVNWDSEYITGGFVPKAAYGNISTIKFKYVFKASISAYRWVVISTAET